MNRHLILLSAWFLSALHLIAYPSLTTKVSHIDGLPARLLSTGDFDPDLIPAGRSIDLAPALRVMGCAIVDGETIIYLASSGTLLRNLSEDNHRIVDEIVDTLYRADNMVETCRAYIDLLEPLAAEERLKVVNRVGFLPDPLVASMVEKRRLVRAAKPLEASKEELSRLDRATLAVVDIAIDRMKKQLATLKSLETEQGGARQPATAPESKAESKENPKPESEPAPR
jgi:hypothetical protein